jgi:predicted methyltransferase
MGGEATPARRRGKLAAMKRLSLLVVVSLAATAAAQDKRRMADPRWTLLRAGDRTEEDRKEDEARKPLELLRFLDVKPGMKVADLGAGGGYTTELLVRAVGPSGTVHAQNTQQIIDKFVPKAWPARLARPINKNVKALVRDFDEPLPPEVKDLDLAISAFVYHDTAWLGTDRAKMNRTIFAALRPGGRYVILDHAGREGSGTSEAKTLHRIEEKAVIEDVEKAGFKLEKKGDFLRNPEDPRDAGVFGPLRGKTDRFVLSFVKPGP